MNLTKPDVEMQSGRDLARARKAAGLNQTELGRLAGFGRHAVSYWECKPRLCFRSPAVRAMLKALGLPHYWTTTHARVMGSYTAKGFDAAMLAQRWPLYPFLSKSKPRHKCGARTRRGTPCQALSLPGKARCKNHGGLSTGPKTVEGREKIATAQRDRWRAFRNQPRNR